MEHNHQLGASIDVNGKFQPRANCDSVPYNSENMQRQLSPQKEAESQSNCPLCLVRFRFDLEGGSVRQLRHFVAITQKHHHV